MRLFCQILLACVALAILQAALAVVVVGVLLAALVCLICKPRETLGLIGLCLTLSLLQTQPAVALILIVAILVLSRLNPRPRTNADCEPLRLTHGPTVEPSDGRDPNHTDDPT